MARTIIIITAFIVATANAGFVWQDDDFGSRSSFKFPKMTFPTFPSFPTFPAFPHLTFPTIPPIVIPSPADIAKQKGPNYNGISVSSSSSSTVDKDGKVIQTGGTTIITNKDGVVKEFTYGDNPPNVISQPRMFIPKVPIFHPILPMIPFGIPMGADDLKGFKPGKNQNFIGTSSSSFTQSSDVNGVKTSKGGATILSNVNGKVEEKSIHFGENDD